MRARDRNRKERRNDEQRRNTTNRRSEDMKGLYFARAMRVRCPWLAVVFMAALWPVRLHQCALGIRERFLTKPVAMLKLVRTVRELLAAAQPA